MHLAHLENLHEREKRRIAKGFIPRGALRLYHYMRYRTRFPTAFVSSGSKVAQGAFIGKNCLVQEASIGPRVEIGDFTTIGHQGRMDGGGRIRIGKFCSVAPECFIWSENHNPKAPSCYPFEHMLKGRNENWEEYPAADVEIGHGVWIGQRVTILAGAKIGSGCVVASGAVVPAGEYLPYSLIGGVPGKVIKQRLNDETITTLEEMKWWDRPEQEIFGTLMARLHGRDKTGT